LKDAKSEAVRIATFINAGDAEGASLTGADRQELVRANEVVSPLNLDVTTACVLFAEAANLVGVHAVVAAAPQ